MSGIYTVSVYGVLFYDVNLYEHYYSKSSSDKQYRIQNTDKQYRIQNTDKHNTMYKVYSLSHIHKLNDHNIVSVVT